MGNDVSSLCNCEHGSTRAGARRDVRGDFVSVNGRRGVAHRSKATANLGQHMAAGHDDASIASAFDAARAQAFPPKVSSGQQPARERTALVNRPWMPVGSVANRTRQDNSTSLVSLCLEERSDDPQVRDCAGSGSLEFDSLGRPASLTRLRSLEAAYEKKLDELCSFKPIDAAASSKTEAPITEEESPVDNVQPPDRKIFKPSPAPSNLTIRTGDTYPSADSAVKAALQWRSNFWESNPRASPSPSPHSSAETAVHAQSPVSPTVWGSLNNMEAAMEQQNASRPTQTKPRKLAFNTSTVQHV